MTGILATLGSQSVSSVPLATEPSCYRN